MSREQERGAAAIAVDTMIAMRAANSVSPLAQRKLPQAQSRLTHEATARIARQVSLQGRARFLPAPVLGLELRDRELGALALMGRGEIAHNQAVAVDRVGVPPLDQERLREDHPRLRRDVAR